MRPGWGKRMVLKMTTSYRLQTMVTMMSTKGLAGLNYFFLQVADQSGKSVDLPPAEKKAIIIAMSLHEKGRAALKRRDYPTALVLLLEAETEFSACSSDLLNMVDNYAILSLDIAWCYLALNTVSELPMAEERLQVCEQKFKASYGADMERVAALKGSSGNEAALMARLNLVQVGLRCWFVVISEN